MTTADIRTLPEAKDQDLNRLLEQSTEGPVLIYFTVSWCGPCKVFGPLLDKYAFGRPDLVAYRVDCEASPGLAAHFDVGLFPTLAVIRHRGVHWSKSGAMDEAELRTTVDAITVAAGQVDAGELGSSIQSVSFPDVFELPLGFDTRVRVEAVRRNDEANTTDVEQLSPGATFSLASTDGLHVIVESDERRSQPLDLSALAELPKAPYEFIVINARTVSAEQMAHVAGLRDIDTLLISALEPLDQDAVEALTLVQARSLHAQIPGFDAEQLRRRKPGTTVNYTAMSAALVAHLPEAVQPESSVVWTTVNELVRRVASGDRVVAMVQLEHPADMEIGSAWHRAARLGELSGALTVSCYATDLAVHLALEARCPAVVVWERGEVVRRLELPFTEAEVDQLALLGVSGNPESIASVPERPERLISLPESAGTATKVELVAPGTSSAGAVIELLPGLPEHIPQGWCLRVRASLTPDDDAPWETWGLLGVQALHLEGTISAQALAGVAALTHLEHLEIMSAAPPSSGEISAVATKLPSLRSVRIYGLENPETIGEANGSLIVNGDWPLLPVERTER